MQHLRDYIDVFNVNNNSMNEYRLIPTHIVIQIIQAEMLIQT